MVVLIIVYQVASKKFFQQKIVLNILIWLTTYDGLV